MNTVKAFFALVLWYGLFGEFLAGELNERQRLGKRLFFDASLSSPPGQGCFSCHSPTAGFADPRKDQPVSAGVYGDRFGSRNAPSAAYAGFSPEFHFDSEEGLYVGGQFWDGRASTLEEQAKGPLLNPVEMANPDKATVVGKVREGGYQKAFDNLYGPGALDDVETAFDRVVDAIAAYERSEEVNPFSSKYDAYLRGEVDLSVQEARGLALFKAEDKGNCAACHPADPGPDGTPPLFTDFTYDNLGVPKNAANPFYRQSPTFNPQGEDFVDPGLEKTTGDPAQRGKHKVSTLRNIALTAPYMHNGAIETLRDSVQFYNRRDRDSRWQPPEVAENVNREELGDLGLSEQEVDDIVAFMLTLTDGYRAEAD